MVADSSIVNPTRSINVSSSLLKETIDKAILDICANWTIKINIKKWIPGDDVASREVRVSKLFYF